MPSYPSLYPRIYGLGIEVKTLKDSHAVPSAHVLIKDVLANLDPWDRDLFTAWVKTTDKPYSTSVYPWFLERFLRDLQEGVPGAS